MAIGRFLEQQRSRAGMSQASFARFLGVNQQSYWLWVAPGSNRQPNPESCLQIAKALGLEAEEVLRIAGHLPGPKGKPVLPLSADVLDVARRYDALPHDYRGFVESAIAQAESIVNQAARSRHSSTSKRASKLDEPNAKKKDTRGRPSEDNPRLSRRIALPELVEASTGYTLVGAR